MKKNILKKWWFWVIVVIVVGVSQNYNNSNINTVSNRSVESQKDNYSVLKSFENTVWEPDFVVYPNNYHEDNPILKLVSISNDGTVITFKADGGETYTAKICSGWDNPEIPDDFADELYLQYKFDKTDLFYGFTFHGCTPKSKFDEPSIHMEVTRGGWYTVIYTMKK